MLHRTLLLNSHARPTQMPALLLTQHLDPLPICMVWLALAWHHTLQEYNDSNNNNNSKNHDNNDNASSNHRNDDSNACQPGLGACGASLSLTG